MKNRIIKTAFIFLGLWLCALVDWSWNPVEPRYRDRKLSSWLRNYPKYKQQAWREAEAAIKACGTNGIPYIFAELRRRDAVKMSVSDKLWFIGPFWVRRLVGPPKRRFDESYAPELFRAIGPVSVPALVAALGDRSDRVRLAAVEALAEFRSQAKSAIPELTNLLAAVPARSRIAISLTNTITQIDPEAVTPLSSK